MEGLSCFSASSKSSWQTVKRPFHLSSDRPAHQSEAMAVTSAAAAATDLSPLDKIPVSGERSTWRQHTEHRGQLQ